MVSMIKHFAPTTETINPLALASSLTDIGARTQRLIVDFLTRRPDLGNLGDPAGIGRAFLDLTTRMMSDPLPVANAQLELWADLARLWQHAMGRLVGVAVPSERPVSKDRRFEHPAWTEQFAFDYIKQSY